MKTKQIVNELLTFKGTPKEFAGKYVGYMDEYNNKVILNLTENVPAHTVFLDANKKFNNVAMKFNGKIGKNIIAMDSYKIYFLLKIKGKKEHYGIIPPAWRTEPWSNLSKES